MTTIVESIRDPRAHQEAVVAKERGDVIQSLNGIEETMAGIIGKIAKLKDTPDAPRRKLYKKQIKDSNKYLDTLFTALKLEMAEAINAEYILERMPEKPRPSAKDPKPNVTK